MTYQEAVSFLTSLPRTAGAPTLERMRRLMEALGNPQDSLKFIHIAGTNGKGSTAAMIAKMLEVGGNRVGLFVSPYIYSFTERIQINGRPIPESALARLTQKLLPYRDGLTAFEAVTALGFCYFLQEQCDWVVLEVGLGGRFDATNIIKDPAMSVLTHIDLDHTELLGNSVEKVAMEKCGIIRPEGTVVTTPQQHPEALKVIRRVCSEKRAALRIARAVTIENEYRGKLEIRQGERVYALGMTAHYQAENAATALCVAECLGLSQEARRLGLLRAVMPGRFEWRTPHLLLDGAHNPNGLLALYNCLMRITLPEEVCLILGMLPDKNREAALPFLRRVSDKIIVVPVHNARGDNGKALLRSVKKYWADATLAPDVKTAIAQADRDVAVVCGSLYLLGEI